MSYISLLIQVGEVPKPDHSLAAGRTPAVAWHDLKSNGAMSRAQK